jgi:hypothetical protein
LINGEHIYCFVRGDITPLIAGCQRFSTTIFKPANPLGLDRGFQVFLQVPPCQHRDVSQPDFQVFQPSLALTRDRQHRQPVNLGLDGRSVVPKWAGPHVILGFMADLGGFDQFLWRPVA